MLNENVKDLCGCLRVRRNPFRYLLAFLISFKIKAIHSWRVNDEHFLWNTPRKTMRSAMR